MIHTVKVNHDMISGTENKQNTNKQVTLKKKTGIILTFFEKIIIIILNY